MPPPLSASSCWQPFMVGPIVCSVPHFEKDRRPRCPQRRGSSLYTRLPTLPNGMDMLYLQVMRTAGAGRREYYPLITNDQGKCR